MEQKRYKGIDLRLLLQALTSALVRDSFFMLNGMKDYSKDKDKVKAIKPWEFR